MAEPDITSLRLRIEGAVQAVGFRQFAMDEARKLGLDGWVRNRSDKTVEVLVSGENEAVERFVGACTRGPVAARVANIELEKGEPPAEKGFHQRPTV